eukprot:scaffold3562_cov37-Attheya_sp.AAC.2
MYSSPLPASLTMMTTTRHPLVGGEYSTRGPIRITKPGLQSYGRGGSKESIFTPFDQKCPGRNGGEARKNPVEKAAKQGKSKKKDPGEREEGQARETSQRDQ